MANAQSPTESATFPPLRHGIKAVFGNNGNDHGGDFTTRIPRMIGLMKELNVDLTRIEFKWAINEPERGVYDWSEADRLINVLHDNGIEPMLMFYCPPKWAMVGPPEDEEYFIKKGFENLYTVVWAREEYKADLRRFAEAAARRYKGQTNLFEFWNEPDGMAGPTVLRDEKGKAVSVRFGGDPVLYTEWLKIFYEGIKAGNPEAQVAAGSLCIPYTHFIEAIYACGGKNYFDAVSVHPYPHNSDQINVYIIDEIRNVMVRYGDWQKPMWVTEFGWSTGSDTVDPINPKPTTEMGKQASLISPMFNMVQKRPYITQFYFFTLNDWGGAVENQGEINGFGVVDINLNKKPSYESYKTVVASSSKTPRTVLASGLSIYGPPSPIDIVDATVVFDATVVNTGHPRNARVKCHHDELVCIPTQPQQLRTGTTSVRLFVGKNPETPKGTFDLELHADNSGSDIVQVRNPAVARLWTNKPEIDADLQDWEDRLDIETEKFKAGFGWDALGLYLACSVMSSTITMGHTDLENWPEEHLWQWDSLQLGIDPLRDAVRGALFRPDDSEYLFALTDKGLQVRRYAAMDGRHVGIVKTGNLAIKKVWDHINYEAFLPWGDFHPGTPKEGDILGVSLMAIQIENGERKLHTWGGGITGAKMPSRYASVMLKP